MSIRNLLCALLFFSSGHSQAEPVRENAEIPYAFFYKMATAKLSGMDLKNKSFSFVFSSTLPDVKAQNIEVYINSKNGRIPLQLDSDGLCLFPIRNDLLEENPYIVSNQPKGTMQTTVSINFESNDKTSKDVVMDVTDNLNLHYMDIFKARQVFTKMFNSFSETLEEYSERFNETSTWIEFTSVKLATSPVVIHSKSKEIKINPDDDGVIRIKYEPRLSKENPIVSFPDRGKIIVRSNNAKPISK